MKKLSVEEKAKRYDEVLDRAKKEVNTCGSQDCDAARQIFRFFPELKESEDERIRKELIYYFKENNAALAFKGISNDCILDWLKKQGEHKKFHDSIQIGDKVTRNKDGVLVNLSQLNRVAKKDEKQDEQKSSWSEEDEKIYKSILDDTVTETQLGDKQITWLKSLKDRVRL